MEFHKKKQMTEDEKDKFSHLDDSMRKSLEDKYSHLDEDLKESVIEGILNKKKHEERDKRFTRNSCLFMSVFYLVCALILYLVLPDFNWENMDANSLLAIIVGNFGWIIVFGGLLFFVNMFIKSKSKK